MGEKSFEQIINEKMTVAPQDARAASETIIARLAIENELQLSQIQQLIAYAEELHNENQELKKQLDEFSPEALATKEFEKDFEAVESGEYDE